MNRSIQTTLEAPLSREERQDTKVAEGYRTPRLIVFNLLVTALFAIGSSGFSARAAETQAEIKNLSVDGQMGPDKTHWVIQADLKGLGEGHEKVIYGTTLEHALRVETDKISHIANLKVSVVQGDLREIALSLSGEGEVRQVTGDGLEDWSTRRAAGGGRFLVMRLKKTDKPIASFAARILSETALDQLPKSLTPLSFAAEQPTLFQGYVLIETPADLDAKLTNAAGLTPIEPKYLPESLKPTNEESGENLAFRFQGSTYSLPMVLSSSDPEARRVVLDQFQLKGKLKGDTASFSLTARARVRNPKGGSIDLLSGGVALTEVASGSDWRLKFENGRFVASFDKAGEFAVKVEFNAAVRESNGWNQVEFAVAPAVLQPIVLAGLGADTQFQFSGAAKPERAGEEFRSFLPANGVVAMSWKEARPEAEGKLFYSAEALSQVALSPGLMRQSTLFEFKVMQGELNRITLLVQGEGEVTRVLGQQVLAWNVEPVPNSTDRRLVVQLNQAQKDQFSLQVQMQRTLGAFPQAMDAALVTPEGTTRFGGYVRVMNEGAVRLEILTASGLSQLSPEQFPQTDATRAMIPPQSTQTFAYRHSGAAYQLRIQADNILPELAVSEVLIYHLAETELAIEDEIELDIREAPLRELLLRIPKGFVISRLNASGLSDHFLTEKADAADAELRLVYGSPVAGRQVVQLRLERNKPLGETTWDLPRVEVVKAKSVRGNVGVSAEAGFRLTPSTTQGLTDIAPAFFAKQVPGLQAAFRINDAAWQAKVSVERLAQTIQADVLHLFSVGEGIAYGSSVLNYGISGAPVSAFKIELSSEYFNVEFTGREVRNWQKTDQGYVVQLHTPVSGAYTLLATYERPFKPQGETLTFTGARPLDAQTEQGHTVVVSTYQFQVQAVNVSPTLIALEPGEVPAEYRLFFDAPVLAAYRYSARPFNLQLSLKPLTQAATVSQVVDRAVLTTRISDEGQVVTDGQYFVKNKGVPNFRITPPAGMQLWSVTVNGAQVVPVTDGAANLVPLPQRADPNAVNELRIKLAAKSSDPRRLKVGAPIVAAPVLLTEWRVEPGSGRRLVYRGGSLTPVGGEIDISGFAGLARVWASEMRSGMLMSLGLWLVLMIVGTWMSRFATAAQVRRPSARHLLGGLLAATAFGVAIAILIALVNQARGVHASLPIALRFVAPVQQAESALELEIGNIPMGMSLWTLTWAATPLLAVLVWLAYALVGSRASIRRLAAPVAWTLIGWAALRLPNGLPAFVSVLTLFVVLHLVIPALRGWWRVPKREPVPVASASTAAAVSILLGIGFGLSEVRADAPLATGVSIERGPALAESITQEIRVEKDYVYGIAHIHWQAAQGKRLPLLHAPGVLTRIEMPTGGLRLVEEITGGKVEQWLIAEKSGAYDVDLFYQTRARTEQQEQGFTVPTQYGLVNRVALTLTDQDMDITSPQAVMVEREDNSGTNTIAKLVLRPVNDPWIGWKPRSRDTRREKADFYAELSQLYIPGAGVVEGLHQIEVRPAHGELSELSFDVPGGSTITDVVAPSLSLWRFDPDTRKLRVSFGVAQSKPFTMLVKSQIATGPLPFEQTAGLISVNNAAGQIGLVGIATGSEVQLDEVRAEGFSSINLEDFPAGMLQAEGQTPGLTLRRAYRYSDSGGSLILKAAAVEPDVRVEAQETLSLGEDRIVLAATLAVEVTRAGIFKLSFLLPGQLEVEAISGESLSHWTELKTPEGRLITLHLKGKTSGAQQFSLSLSGPGIRSAQAWAAPRLSLREAAKQQGQLVVVPEQGMRLQVITREGVTQLDPLRSGIRQKGVLAFRLLTMDWQLAMDVEQVQAWIQVTSLQHVSVGEAQMKVAANLHYQIENSGVKSLRVRLPGAAESVRFTGEQVADFRVVDGLKDATNQVWEIKLQRRVTGKYLLQTAYTVPIAQGLSQVSIGGVQAVEVNLQRGFLTVQAGGRLQVRMDAPPAALQAAEWQAIPHALQQDIQASAANYTFRLVDPDFVLPVNIEHHEAAKLLPARVNKVLFTSVVSDDGVMLTQARIEMVPGDKRLLHVTLPEQARFWFAFVNQNSVWPWREQDQILIPLEQHSRIGEAITVEFFYTSHPGTGRHGSLDLHLQGPRLDLPLENIIWRISMSDHWKLSHWSGSLQLQNQQSANQPVAVDLETYVRNEANMQQEQTKEAEQYLSMANSLLEKGDPQRARRAFEAAYGLSQHDNAFNEDARVQLHNLKMQQALVGLNVRQAKVAGESGAGGAAAAQTPRGLREGEAPAYTQQEAKQLIDRNSAEDNAVQMRLAERLIQQQDASVASPAAIHATMPEEARVLTFTRPLLVDAWADLSLDIKAKAAKTVSGMAKLLVLLATGVFALLAVWASRGALRGEAGA